MNILKKTILIFAVGVFVLRPMTALGDTGIKSFFENLLSAKSDQQKKLDEVRKQKAQKEAEQGKLTTDIKKSSDKISHTNESIESLGQKINETEKAIKTTESKLEEQKKKKVLLEENLSKLLISYDQLDGKSAIEIILSASSISAAIDDVWQYNNLSRGIGQSFLAVTASAKELETTNTDLVQYQDQYQNLKEKEITQKIILENEKNNKEKLLVKTQVEIGDLAKQEADLAQREQEVEEEISKYLSGYKTSGQSGQPVKKGDIIGYQGNSGFSTGSHLHFTVFIDNDLKKNQNPNNYLKTGQLAYPLDKWRLNQGYGMTSFARTGAYGGAPHNGIDIASYQGAPVRAAAGGTIIMNKYFGSYGNAIIIDHGNNLYTLYGHLAE